MRYVIIYVNTRSILTMVKGAINMKDNELNQVLFSLLKNNENECVEYKEAKNDYSFDKLGKYFSALSNAANIAGKQYSWLIFGIKDKTHEFVNTNYKVKGDLNKLKKDITMGTNEGITFLDIFEFYVENKKRVIMFKIPAATGVPTTWKGFAYDRNDEELVPLNSMKADQIKSTLNFDWSRQIVQNLNLECLDSDAIRVARERFKQKNENRKLSEEIDQMTDIEFLNKARLTINGNITRTALLLLGKEEYNYLFEDFIPQISWELQDKNEVIDYEHFTIPFLINIEKAIGKIRNLRYRYMVNDITLFPNEVDQYDNYTLRELINNAIAHQDYRKHGRVNIIEMKDKLIFRNEGSFIPQKIDNLVMNEGYLPPYYRNPFLSNAMVNLNMIDTAGSGIKRVFNNQRLKLFPMPDYDLSDESRVKVTLYGKILDEKYTQILFENTDLEIGIVVLLDRVQKGIHITREQASLLKNKKLIEGRYPHLFVSKEISDITNQKAKYIKNRGLSNDMYKEKIIQFINTYGKATRKDIIDLLLDQMSDVLSDEQKKRRIKYLLIECLSNKEKKIKRMGKGKKAYWILNK